MVRESAAPNRALGVGARPAVCCERALFGERRHRRHQCVRRNAARPAYRERPVTPKARAGSTGDARIHMKKANDYYAAAVAALEAETYDPAVSNAVISGINAADVIALVELGRRSDNNDHEASLSLLRN